MRVTPSLLVAIAAVGAANAAAVGSYKSNANTVQLKRSSVLETAAANLAPVAAVRRAELAASFVSLEQRGGGTGASVENAPLDALLGIFGHLDNIIHIGADALIDLLGTAKYAIQTQLDILQVFLNGWFLVAVKAVKGVEGLLKAIISIHVEVSVALIRLIQKLPCLIDFVGAFIGQDIAALINGAKLGLGGLQATPGCEKLVAYCTEYGFENVQSFLAAPGAEGLLKAAVQIPGSAQVLESFKYITDVPAFVSGLSAVGIDPFVSAVQQVNNVAAVNGAAGTVAATVGL